MNLKNIARRYEAFNGAVIFWMLPYRPLKSDMVLVDLDKIYPRAQWHSVHDVFVLAEPTTVDIEFIADLPAYLQGLRIYWQSRNGKTAENFQSFIESLNSDILSEWFRAYEATRDQIVERTTPVGEPPAASE